MPTPNQEQIKSAVRWILSTFGGMLFGIFIAKGWMTADQVQSILSSELIIGLLTSGAALLWSMIVKTKPNLVAATEQLPGVQGVVTSPNEEGRRIANAVPTDNVAVAGSRQASEIAGSA